MDAVANVPEMLREQHDNDSDNNVIARHGEFVVQPLVLTQEKLGWMWQQVQHHKALTAQFGAWGPQQFISLFLQPSSMFFEVLQSGKPVGSIYLANVGSLSNVECHVFFFDGKLVDKVPVCQEALAWAFENLKIHRIGVTVPEPYGATVRFTQRVGFKLEGVRRQFVLLKGRWCDLLEFGMLREELEV